MFSKQKIKKKRRKHPFRRLKTGALWAIRTPDPQLRRLLLYPAELRAQSNHPKTNRLFAYFGRLVNLFS